MFLRNGQDRSLHEQNTIYRVGRGLAPAVNSHRPLRRGQAPALPIKLSLQIPICHPERSEGSPIEQNKKIRNEILQQIPRYDKYAIFESFPIPKPKKQKL